MGYLDDISTIARGIQNIKDVAKPEQRTSIARGALNGTLQFPCLVSDAIPIDMAATISRSFERVYASFVQTYLSLNNTIDISVDKNPSAFLQKIHKNIKLESTELDLYKEYCNADLEDAEYDHMMERIYDGTTKAYYNANENVMITFNFSDKFDSAIFESNKTMMEESLAHIDFTPFPNIGNSPFYEALPPDEDKFQQDILTHQAKKSIDNNSISAADKLKLMNGDKLRVPVLSDMDVKKSNDMQPFVMQVRLMAVNSQQEFVQFMDFLVGIKVVLHNIKSDDMIKNLQNVLQNNGALFNFIRWTTGEKSLFKDLILRINDVKLDVANKSKGASPWWITLKRLKETSRAQAALFSKYQIVPNSTIVISSYDADAIKQNYGYSVRDPRFAKKIMTALFLMNFAIIDEGTRTVEILYDGETAFQTYALETLERELNISSNKLGKELTRMISR